MKFTLLLLSILNITVTAQAAAKKPADLSLICAVVEVGPAGSTVIEEGLGSIYDIDETYGYAGSDGDSTSGGIEIKNGNIRLGLGQAGWDSSENKMTTKEFDYETDMGSDEKGLEITIDDRSGWGGIFTYRVFPKLKIVFVNFSDAKNNTERLAVLDCSGVKDIRNRE